MQQPSKVRGHSYRTQPPAQDRRKDVRLTSPPSNQQSIPEKRGNISCRRVPLPIRRRRQLLEKRLARRLRALRLASPHQQSCQDSCGPEQYRSSNSQHRSMDAQSRRRKDLKLLKELAAVRR